MAPSLRHRPAILRSILLVLLASLLSCGGPRIPAIPPPDEFRLDMPEDFHLSGGRLPDSLRGVWFWLKGEDPILPRLTVRLEPRRMDLLDQLSLEANLGPRALLLDEGEPYDARAVNAEGLGRTVVLAPVPELDSTLVLAVDIRVFGVGEQMWVFTWQQDAADSLLLRGHRERMARLLFTDKAGRAPEGDDSLDADPAP